MGRLDILNAELGPFRDACVEKELYASLDEIAAMRQIAVKAHAAIISYLRAIRDGLPITAQNHMVALPIWECKNRFGSDYNLEKVTKWCLYWFFNELQDMVYKDQAPLSSASATLSKEQYAQARDL